MAFVTGGGLSWPWAPSIVAVGNVQFEIFDGNLGRFAVRQQGPQLMAGKGPRSSQRDFLSVLAELLEPEIEHFELVVVEIHNELLDQSRSGPPSHHQMVQLFEAKQGAATLSVLLDVHKALHVQFTVNGLTT